MRILQLLFAIVVILLLQDAPGKDQIFAEVCVGLWRDKRQDLIPREGQTR